MQQKSWFSLVVVGLVFWPIASLGITSRPSIEEQPVFPRDQEGLRPEDRSPFLVSDVYTDSINQLLELTNRQRQNNGLSRLALSPSLGRAAQNHAGDMVVRNFFSHSGSNGSSVADRAREEGYQFQAIGENIAMGTNRTPSSAIEGWMNSPGHRSNILNPNYTEIGFGIALRGNEYYYVQVFGRGSGSATAAPPPPSNSSSATPPPRSPQSGSGARPISPSGGSDRPSNRGNSLLQETGNLSTSSQVLASDNSFYNIHTFSGRAGQVVEISLSSREFDTYLGLLDPNGQEVGQNDDVSEGNTNSFLRVTLPSNGTYQIFVNGFDRNNLGRYNLSVTSP